MDSKRFVLFYSILFNFILFWIILFYIKLQIARLNLLYKYFYVNIKNIM